MKILDATRFMDISQFDWGSYFEKGTSSFKKKLEENFEMWQKWTNSDKRYMLVCFLGIVKDDIDNSLSGEITGYLDFYVGSDNLKDLRLLWNSKFIQQRYESRKQHFIADMKEKKIIEFCSICM